MANVVRFVLESQRSFDVPGAGMFIDGVLDIPSADVAAVQRARFLVGPYGGVEYGTVDSSTAPPTLPAVPLPPGPDPYPQYLSPNELLDGDGKLLSSKLPSRLSETELRAAFVPGDPVLSEFVYATDGTGNLLSYKEDGVAIVLTYNADGTVATSKRGTAPAKTFAYTGGNLVGVA